MDSVSVFSSRSYPARILELTSAALALVVIVGLLLPEDTQAQQFRWDVSAGATASAFQGDPTFFAGQDFFGNDLPTRFEPRLGFTLGIGVRGALTPWLNARTGLRYAQGGGVVERELIGPADGPAEETITLQLDYLSVPLFAEARLPQPVALGLRPFLYGGPALRLSVRSTEERVYRSFTIEERADRSANTPTWTASIVTGTGIAYQLPNGGDLVLDLRYSYGLTDVGIADHDRRFGTAQAGVQYVLP